MNNRKGIVVYLFFVILSVLFFYKVFLGFLPIPGDLLIGGYYPWLDYKWGYSVGVPVKNSALSDVISTAYPWRDLALNIIKHGEIPLWNPYVFSGGPLLANWQSAAYYPLNIFMLLFDHEWGWSVMVMLQTFLSSIFMYLLLRCFKLSHLSSIFGSIVFAFSGFMLIFLEYNYLQAGVWLPLIILSIEKYLKTSKNYWLLLLSISVLITTLGGNFQILLYSLIVSFLYIVFRSRNLLKDKNLGSRIFILALFLLLGELLAAFQLLPTIELFVNSIRGLDSNIIQQNYGLLPIKNLITFLSPDFFGNPATGNFKGFLYHETSGYFGVIPLILSLSIIFRKKDFITVFFSTVFLISIILLFDSFIGRLIFTLNIPLVSSSYASRILYLVVFSASILVAKSIELIKENIKIILSSSLLLLFILITTALALIFFPQTIFLEATRVNIALHNLILPIFLLTALIIGFKFIKNKNVLIIFLILITIADLFRFGWKYNPFVKANLIYPKTPIINFLQQNSGFYRIEREKSEVIPPNTWMMYDLASPSGYDPLVYLPYAQFYNIYNQNSPFNGVSRYLELGKYNSSILDLLGVKYLVVAKRVGNKIDKSSTKISEDISDPKFKRVFEDGTVIVLENTNVMKRASLFNSYVVADQSNSLRKIYEGFDFKHKVLVDKEVGINQSENNNLDTAQIISYSPNMVKISTQVDSQSILMLTDTNYPGWKVYINNVEAQMLTLDGIFRGVVVPSGNSNVDFIFKPTSFKIGCIVSISSLFIMFFLISLIRYNKNE